MSVQGVETRTHEELLRIAQENRAAHFGQWSLRDVQPIEPLSIVGQPQLRSELHANEQRLRELGLLAATGNNGRRPYFVR